jgi:hypothetical protein
VAADLGLVAHAAQRLPHELAAGGVGDRPRQRGLADAGRADQAQDRALHVIDQRLHGEVLEDALLDLLQAVVLGVEDALGLGDVVAVLGLLVPRQRQDPVEVVAHHRRLGRHRRHHLELLQLLAAALLGLLRHPLGLDLGLELGELVLELVAVTQLLLDGLHLLVQVVLLLRLLHLLLHAGADLLLHLEDLDLGLHELVEALEALGRRGRLEQLLLVLQLQVDVGDDRVGQATRLLDRLHAHQHLGRDALVELHVGLEHALHRAHQRRQLDRALVGVRQAAHLDREVRDRAVEARDLRAGLALDQHLHRAVGQAQQLDDVADRADREDVLLARVVGLGLLLGGQHQLLVAGHRVFERADRLLAAHEQRDHHVREHDDVAQREQGQRTDRGLAAHGHLLYAGGTRWQVRVSVGARRSHSRRSRILSRWKRGKVATAIEAFMPRSPLAGVSADRAIPRTPTPRVEPAYSSRARNASC